MAITQKYLKKLFDYKDGHLIRKVRRGPSHKGDACAAYDRAKTEYHKFHSVPCQAKKN